MCLAVPMKLLEVMPETATGVVDMGGATRTVGLDLVPEAGAGDYVLVHTGMAIEVVSETEARETLEMFHKYAAGAETLSPGSEAADEDG